MTLENITGNLLQAYKQCVPGTMLCVDQLMTTRRTDEDLRHEPFYTADGMVYIVDKSVPTLLITREAVNPVLNNIDDAFTQLTTKHNYPVSPADFDAVKSAPDTVTIDLTKLMLQSNDKEWRYLAISTTNYDTLNPEERKLAERIYGQGTDFTENMRMLKDAGITETRVYVLNPVYVKEHATKNAVGRASWLNNFNNYSYFNANDRYIINIDRFRGVRREVVVAAGDAPKNKEVPPVPQAPAEVKFPTMEKILSTARQYVPDCNWKNFQTDVRKLYKP